MFFSKKEGYLAGSLDKYEWEDTDGDQKETINDTKTNEDEDENCDKGRDKENISRDTKWKRMSMIPAPRRLRESFHLPTSRSCTSWTDSKRWLLAEAYDTNETP